MGEDSHRKERRETERAIHQRRVGIFNEVKTKKICTVVQFI